MEAEDLIVKAKDVQMLRVTKELQERLMMDNIQRKDQNQIETLEKTLELNQKVLQDNVIIMHKGLHVVACAVLNLLMLLFTSSLNITGTLISQIHRRRLVRKKKKLGVLNNEVKNMAEENSELESVLQEKAVEMVERQQIQDLAGTV